MPRTLQSGRAGGVGTAGVGVLLAVLAHGPAKAQLATNGTTSNVIHACVERQSHELRVVGSNQACGRHETPLSWNIQGPPGPMGPAGPAGPQGQGGTPGSAAGDPTGLSLVDGNAKPIGTLADCCNVVVSTPVGPVLMGVDSTGFQSNGNYYFKEDSSFHCTSTPYLQANGVFSFEVVDSVSSAFTYSVSVGTNFQQLTMQSVLMSGMCMSTKVTGLFGPASPLTISGFTPPFSPK